MLDNIALEQAKKDVDSWVIKPVIFTNDKKDIRVPIITNIGIEMMGDSNVENIENGVFKEPSFDEYDIQLMLSELNYQQVEVLTKVLFNSIEESTNLNFKNYCNYLFKEVIQVNNMAIPIIILDDNTPEAIWIKNQIRSYIEKFVFLQKRYNIMQKTGTSLLNGSNIEQSFPESWIDYTSNVSVNLSQYICSIFTSKLHRHIMARVYNNCGRVNKDESLNELVFSSKCINSAIQAGVDVNSATYSYLCQLIYPSLYDLVMYDINGSIYKLLSNVPLTFVSLFSDLKYDLMHRDKNN
jgi:hypothetical protein